jgi:L-threonylcarbamoyladenylate synthase
MIIDISNDMVVTTAVDALQNNGIVIVPTSRWYMICCSASSLEATNSIFKAKQRAKNKIPLFLLPNKQMAQDHFVLSADASKLINHLWPGGLSLYLNWKNTPNEFDFGNVGYGLTSVEEGLMGKITTTFSAPLFATSVNISGEINNTNLGPAISLAEVQKFIDDTRISVDLVIDGGICPMFNHTTIIDCKDVNLLPIIIREGIVHKRAIETILSNY